MSMKNEQHDYLDPFVANLEKWDNRVMSRGSLKPSPSHAHSALFCRLQERFEQIDRDWEDGPGFVLCCDLVQGLEIAKLQ